MPADDSNAREQLSRDLTNVLIRVGLIAFLVVTCARIFAPFMGLLMWALILAVAVYPLYLKLLGRLGQARGRAATVLVLVGLLLIGGPTVVLGLSFAERVQGAYETFSNEAISIKPPPASVAEWPVVGKKVHAVWSQAAQNEPQFLEDHRDTLTNLVKTVLLWGASAAGSILTFLAALIVAGVIMAYGEGANVAMRRIFSSMAGGKLGPQLQRLSTATVRSVTTGVIGVAFIQALLLGLGFMVSGIPAAGVLAFVVFVLGIAQLPAAIVTLPAIAYIWMVGDSSTVMNVIFTVYLVVAGFVDGVLKPLLLGRGVDAPMPVVLLGALGGMASGGIVGLFVGAVVLSVGYVIFMAWVANTQEREAEAEKRVTGSPGVETSVSE